MADIIQGAKAIRKAIYTALEDNDGALIGRNGSTELLLMIDVNRPYLYSALVNNAGIFPIRSIQCIIKWQLKSIDATKYSDVLATGVYPRFIQEELESLRLWNFQGYQVPLRSLEPYYVIQENQWIQLLSGHRVAVVSSFCQTMQSQVEKLNKVWPSKLMPNDINWTWVQTGYSPGVAKGRNKWPPHVKSWSDAVDYVVSEVVIQGARFALIGCGGLGMLIAKALKERGVIAIVLGGAIQVLFGIKGKRWENHEIISTFWNDAWVWPSEAETPVNARSIEGGCYW